MDKKEQTRLRVQRYRDKKSVTSVTQDDDSVTQTTDNGTQNGRSVTQEPALHPSVTGPPYATSDPTITLPLYPPSKFLSLEQDQILQNRVVEVLKNMSPLRLAEFRALSNTFTPSGNLEDAREIV